jgi:hypothetical protein
VIVWHVQGPVFESSTIKEGIIGFYKEDKTTGDNLSIKWQHRMKE